MILYRVFSKMDQWLHRGYIWGNVEIAWTCERPKNYEPPISYEQAIVGNPKNPYAQHALNALFIKEEVNALRNYLRENPAIASDGMSSAKRSSYIKCKVEKIKFPVPESSLVFFTKSSDRMRGSYELYEELTYDLPFRVIGYFNLLNCRGKPDANVQEMINETKKLVISLYGRHSLFEQEWDELNWRIFYLDFFEEEQRLSLEQEQILQQIREMSNELEGLPRVRQAHSKPEIPEEDEHIPF